MISANLITVLASLHHVNCLFSSELRFGLNFFPNKINAAAITNVSGYEQFETKWIEQPMDHFNGSDSRTFKIKYIQRLDKWESGGPVYLFVEHIGSESQFLNQGVMLELATETKGAMFSSQHRYYGDNQPFDTAKSENLKFLSSRQALADLAGLIKKIKSSPQFKFSPVVLAGGFYGGNLAVWMRELYPDLVDAAIVSSAPVLAKADFPEYLETIGDIYKVYGSPGCFDEITKVFKYYKRMLRKKKSTEVLKKELNICNDTNLDNKRNRQWFMEANALKLVIAVSLGPSYILDSCQILSEMIKTCNNIDEENLCCDYRLSTYINGIKNNKIVLLWVYQRCTEFGFIITSEKNRPFTASIPKGLDYEICRSVFGKDFDGARLNDGVEKTNQLYGGMKPNVTKVVFVNGGLDPWYKLSVVKNLSPNTPALFLPTVGVWTELFADSLDLSNELVEARNDIKRLIKKWIGP